MKEIYLDNAAATPLDPEVLEAMLPWLKAGYGNASSVHTLGRQAKVMIEDTRDMFADFIGARSSEIYFTSGGTEADNFAVKGITFSRLGDEAFTGSARPHIISSAIEHSAVLNSAKYYQAKG
ncbi:MAG TPA: aminotransferase class V-fold PLP-dependent enzyme, partial [Ignavibacteria bacterium]|nr:aminotransferase class V-fold PLP-dependent enzyme [Ignavibacteria bacterium]